MSKIANRVVRAYGAVTDPGKRDVNEDAYIAVPERQLFGIADGYGGNGVGDFAAKKILEQVKYFVDHGLGDSEVTLPFVYRGYYTPGANLIFNAYLYSNQQLVTENKSKPMNARGGASAVFAFFENHHMTMASVGMCKAVLIRNGKVQTLLTPRSYNFVKGNFWEKANPNWAFPLTGFGHSADLEPEIVELKIRRDDIVILATDGLYSGLKEEDFAQCSSIVTEAIQKNSPIDEAILKQNQRLMELAQNQGDGDNKSLITLVFN